MAIYKGGCACGQVRYESTADPLRMINCHCRDCQRASGSAYAPIMIFPSDSVTLTGELRHYAATSDRGNRVNRGFCPGCGSPVAGTLDGRPEVLFIQAASLDDPTLFRPSANIWTQSAPSWDHMDPGLPRFERAPG